MGGRSYKQFGAGNRGQGTGDREQGTGYRGQGTGNWELGVGSWELGAGGRGYWVTGALAGITDEYSKKHQKLLCTIPDFHRDRL